MQGRYHFGIWAVLWMPFSIHQYRAGLTVADEKHDCRFCLTGNDCDRLLAFILRAADGNRGVYQTGGRLSQLLFKGKMRRQREVCHDGDTVFPGFLDERKQCLPDTGVFSPVIGTGLSQFLRERFQ